jgi:hypothetical protein
MHARLCLFKQDQAVSDFGFPDSHLRTPDNGGSGSEAEPLGQRVPRQEPGNENNHQVAWASPTS